MFKIDSRGDISAHLEDYIQAFEAYSAAICLNVADEGMLPFYLHLSDAELLLRLSYIVITVVVVVSVLLVVGASITPITARLV